MTLPLAPRMEATEAPPVMEARRWLEGVVFPPDRPLINVSQAAPMEAPPEGLRQALAEAALNDPAAHLYGPVLGLPALREEIAARWSVAYGGQIAAGEVAVTQGCNQAFCAAMATIAATGDEVILPTPWYFNHKMWLDMQGIAAAPLPCGPGLIPSAEAAEALITDRTKAIVLVTPNNPDGVEYPAGTVRAFHQTAAAKTAASAKPISSVSGRAATSVKAAAAASRRSGTGNRKPSQPITATPHRPMASNAFTTM